MRFAMLEIKLVLAKILKKFEISSKISKFEMRDSIWSSMRPSQRYLVCFKSRDN